MTQQDAEMPPRIWANVVVVANGQALCGEWNYRDVGAPADTEYVRADLARPSQAGDERVARLVEAARVFEAFFQRAMRGFSDGYPERRAEAGDEAWGWNDGRLYFADFLRLSDALAAMDTPKGGGDE